MDGSIQSEPLISLMAPFDRRTVVRLDQRRSDVVKVIGSSRNADERWIALAAVVIDARMLYVSVGLQDHADRLLAGPGVVYCLQEDRWREDLSVDGDNFLRGEDSGLVCGAVPQDVADLSLVVYAKPNRVPAVDGAEITAERLHEHLLRRAFLIGKDQLVSAALNAVKVDLRVDAVNAIVKEPGPVVGQNLIEVGA